MEGGNEWWDIESLTFGFPFNYNYRIKPQIRPYKNAEEFFEALKEHGPMIQWNSTTWGTPRCLNMGKEGFYVEGHIPAHSSVSFEDLTKYKWYDGTPLWNNGEVLNINPMRNCKNCDEPDKGLYGQCPGNSGLGCLGDWRCCLEMNKVCTGCKNSEYCEYTECLKMKEFRSSVAIT